MTVTKTPAASTSGGTQWIRISGTIQEVLDALSAEMFSANNAIYWTDDDTDAVVVVCRQA